MRDRHIQDTKIHCTLFFINIPGRLLRAIHCRVEGVERGCERDSDRRGIGQPDDGREVRVQAEGEVFHHVHVSNRFGL